MTFIETLVIACIPAAFTGILTYVRFHHELQKYKVDTMAETTAKHFLEHKTFTDRSFETLKKNLGGWDNDEDGLRRILVRAGAIRTFREDNSEWWTLLSRIPEKIDRMKEKNS